MNQITWEDFARWGTGNYIDYLFTTGLTRKQIVAVLDEAVKYEEDNYMPFSPADICP